MLKIENLTVKAENKEILKDFNLDINEGEIHVLMGPNGVGKSTICKALLHHPDYEITKGSVIFNDKNLNLMNTTDISRLGFFLLAQNPIEIEGITNAEMIRNVLSETTGKKVDIFEFNKKLNTVCELLELPKPFVHRDINFNMSGGEKKNELLHLFMLEPTFIMLDEIDSGLDVDALKIVGSSLKKYYDLYHPSILIVTHHADILKYFDDYQVHILSNGHIIKSGNKKLASEIEKYGFNIEKTKANVISGEEKMNKLLVVEDNKIINGEYVIEYSNNAHLVIEDASTLYNYDKNANDVVIDILDNSSLIMDKVNILSNDFKMDIHLKNNSNLILNILILNKGKNNATINIDMLGNESKAVIKLRAINMNADSNLNVICNGIINEGTINNELLEDLKGLILYDDTIKISPNMLVSTNEVMANHLVTIGPINEEELFYLKSRGLSEELARNLMRDAFITSIFSPELKENKDGGEKF